MYVYGFRHIHFESLYTKDGILRGVAVRMITNKWHNIFLFNFFKTKKNTIEGMQLQRRFDGYEADDDTVRCDFIWDDNECEEREAAASVPLIKHSRKPEWKVPRKNKQRRQWKLPRQLRRYACSMTSREYEALQRKKKANCYSNVSMWELSHLLRDFFHDTEHLYRNPSEPLDYQAIKEGLTLDTADRLLFPKKSFVIEEAVEFSRQPRVLVEARSPHHIVHANAASFCSESWFGDVNVFPVWTSEGAQITHHLVMPVDRKLEASRCGLGVESKSMLGTKTHLCLNEPARAIG